MCTFFCWISDSVFVHAVSENESVLHNQNVNNGIDDIQTDLAMTGGIDFVKQVSWFPQNYFTNYYWDAVVELNILISPAAPKTQLTTMYN